MAPGHLPRRAFGVGFQIWLEAAHPISPDRPPFTTSTRVWNVLSFFTIWSNILVTVVALLLTLDPRRQGRVFNVFRIASLVMITITAIVYTLVLAPIWNPTGLVKVADETLHYTVPTLAILSYLLVGPRPRFSARTLWWSLAIPLVWIAYTLVRSPNITWTRDGVTHHWYPYHFIDVDDLGYGTVLRNSAGVFLLLAAVGWLYLL